MKRYNIERYLGLFVVLFHITHLLKGVEQHY